MAMNDNNGNSSAYEAVFGKNKAPTTNGNGAAKTDRPKAQLWLNIGYQQPVIVDGEEVEEFVALAQGIPLDTIEKLPANSRNDSFRARQAAQNNLHDQLMQKAATLEPGEEVIVNLKIQLRRVNDEAAPVADDANPYVRQLDL